MDPPADPPAPAPPRYSRDAIHLARTLQTVTVSLSQMADQKASILMGATFVVFTIAVGQAKNGNMPVALSVLALFAFASAMCAVAAVLPSIGGQTRPGSTAPNRMFFGVFANMPEAVWIEEMMQGLEDDGSVLRLILHDVYQNGVVLQRKKYRFLGYAYRIFMLGLTLTVVTFGIERIWFHTPAG